MGFSLGGILGAVGGALNPVGLIGTVGAGLLGGGMDYFSAQQAANAQRDVNSENVSFGREQMGWSAQQAQKQMEFQERMSNTAFQRAAADLKAAGINPMLAATASESSPSGASGSIAGATQLAVPPTLGALSSGAKDMVRMLQDLSESNSRKALNSDLAAKARADAGLAQRHSDVAASDAYIERLKRQLLEKFVGTAKRIYNANPDFSGNDAVPWYERGDNWATRLYKQGNPK